MSYLPLSYLHMLTVLPAFFIGTFLLLNTKGTRMHRWLGEVYQLVRKTHSF